MLELFEGLLYDRMPSGHCQLDAAIMLVVSTLGDADLMMALAWIGMSWQLSQPQKYLIW